MNLNEGLYNPYSSPNNRGDELKDERGEVCSMHGDIINAYKILVRKSEGKRMDIKKIVSMCS
jgi:hypothetical protein